MLFGISSDEKISSIEPELPKDVAQREKVDLEQLEEMRDHISLGILKRARKSQMIIVNYESKHNNEEPTEPEGGVLAKKPSYGKQIIEKTSEN